ncbi:MAG: hypothetical protein CMD22_06260 [Flavobacteriales bacterium]|nr:hypothetical protein [Flavobacteriales bacterium]
MVKIIKENRLISLFSFYFFHINFIKPFFKIYILILSIWNKTFIECWFCGSTTVCIYILTGEFLQAWMSNKMIFIVQVILLLYYFKFPHISSGLTHLSNSSDVR